MLALSAYHQWLAKGVEMYPDKPIYGRGFPAPKRPDELSYERGETLYQEQCVVCHGADGEGLQVGGKTVFPAPGVTTPITGARALSGCLPRPALSRTICPWASPVPV